MNVYDFDETIFRRDSTACFYFHCLRRHPGLLRYLPSGAAAFFRHYVLHRGGKTEAKERFYRWFRAVPDMESAVSDFGRGISARSTSGTLPCSSRTMS